MYFRVFFLAAILFGPFVVGAQCPVACDCEDTDEGAKAKCSNLNLTEVIPQGKHDSLKILDISFNNIVALEDRVFHDNLLLELKHLNISHNSINKIHMNAFVLMSELKILDLSHNDLSAVGPSAFSPLFQNLEELYLSNNNLLVLSGRFVFAKLTLLDLSNCHHQALPEKYRQDMQSLVHLNLAFNDIKAIDQNLAEASELKNLASLNLQGNKMTSLDRKLLLFRKNIRIDLTDNPWECDCSLFELMSQYEQRKFRPSLTCGGPEEFEGRYVTESLIEEGNCIVLVAGPGIIWTSLMAVGIIAAIVVIFVVLAIRRRREERAERRKQDERNSWGLLYDGKNSFV